MGADIYLRSVSRVMRDKYDTLFNEVCKARNEAKTEKEKERLQKKVEVLYDLMNSKGYFRDSYNDSSLLNVLGLSWWRDIGPLLNDKNELPIHNAMLLLKLIESSKVSSQALREIHFEDLKDSEVTNYFIDKKVKLIKLLKQSIKLNEPLYCSI